MLDSTTIQLKMNNKTKLIVIFLIFTISSYAQDCNDLPEYFNSYSEALNEVKSARFEYYVSEDTSYNGSWIKSISFYSCDLESGYLIVETDRKEYIYGDVPIYIWYDFKETESYGTYFNDEIDGYYQLQLN